MNEGAAKNPQWHCQWQKDLSSWTVGQPRALQCWGKTALPTSSKVKIQFPDEKFKYALKVLETRVHKGDQVQLDVVAYRPGPFQKVTFQLVAGDQKVDVNNLSWQVKSVIPKGKPPKPYGPYGPYEVTYPWWVWLAVALLILMPLLWGQRVFRRWLQRKRLREELAQNSTALSPYHHFSKELRQISRKYQSANRQSHDKKLIASYLKELQATFTMYLTRELIIPAKDWSSHETIREIKRRYKKKISEELTDDIRKLLVEFERGQREVSRLTVEDCDQLLSWSRKVADGLHLKLKEGR